MPESCAGRTTESRRVVMSPGSTPASTFSYSAQSATLRASGPQWQ